MRQLLLLLMVLLVASCTTPRSTPSTILDGPLAERLAQRDLKLGDPVFIRIFKEESLLELWMERSNGHYLHFANYPICNYSGTLGPKFYEGDKQAPEGFYRVTRQMLNPNSRYYKSFDLGFPNSFDRAHQRTGSYLMVHGDCVSVGCYAMRDDQIDEIYRLVESALRAGQPYVEVHAFPFRMEKKRMRLAQFSPHYPFWKELERGYRLFEKHHRIPTITVHNGHYHVH